MRVIIVDDEDRGIIALEQLISKYCHDVFIEGIATNVEDAQKIIKEKQPDVIFLDIEMPGGNGFQLLEQFEEINFEIIFVTAYEEYALKAIKFSALDYLLKPVKIADLQHSIEKMNKKLSEGKNGNSGKYGFLKNMVNESNPFKKIILSTMEGYFPIKLEEIIYCKADDSYTHFFLKDSRHHVVSKHLGEFEEILNAHNFFRIHKSFLININHIEKIKKENGFTVVMSNNDELPISFRKKDEFISKIKENHI